MRRQGGAEVIAKALVDRTRRERHPILAVVAERLALFSGSSRAPARCRSIAWRHAPGARLGALACPTTRRGLDRRSSRIATTLSGLWRVAANVACACRPGRFGRAVVARRGPSVPAAGRNADSDRAGASLFRSEFEPGMLADIPRLAPFALARLSATPGSKVAGALSLTNADLDDPEAPRATGLRPPRKMGRRSGFPLRYSIL